MSENTPNDVDGTEAQRQALEDMSNVLLNRLNTMVAEQEARAAEFATRTHSLSALPEIPLPNVSAPPTLAPVPEPPQSTPKPPAPAPAATPAPEATPAPAAAPAPVQAPPLVLKRQQPATPPTPVRRPTRIPQQQQEDTGNFGAGLLIFIAMIIFGLLRCCS